VSAGWQSSSARYVSATPLPTLVDKDSQLVIDRAVTVFKTETAVFSQNCRERKPQFFWHQMNVFYVWTTGKI